MSVWDGFKFWVGKELGELAFALGFLALLTVGYLLWCVCMDLRARWRRLVRRKP